MSAGDGGKRLRRQSARAVSAALGPVLTSMGFSWGARREAHRDTDVGTFAFQWKQMTARDASSISFPAASFEAIFAVRHHRPDGGTSFTRHRPRTSERVELEQMSIRCHLARTQQMGLGSRSPNVWPVGSEADVEAAIEDCILAIRTQGVAFIETWSDLEHVHQLLQSDMPAYSEGTIAEPALQFPGNPESANRFVHLAFVADLLGDAQAERVYLAGVMEKLGHAEACRARLSELDTPP